MDEEGNSKKLEQADIDVILVMTEGESPETISSRMRKISEIALEHYADVDHLILPIVILVYGTLPLSNEERKPDKLIKTLVEEFQNEIKIVHLKGRGHYGKIGGSKRCSYTFIMPQFTNALSTILSLPFGHVKNI